MSRCHSCNTTLKRGQTHCSQCGERVEPISVKRWKFSFIILILLFVSATGIVFYYWNKDAPSSNTASKPDQQQSFSVSTAPEESEKPAEAKKEESLPDTEIVTGTFYESVSSQEIEQFMYDFVSAFTSATYDRSVSAVEPFLAPGSTFEKNTIDYLENTLFARDILEDQIETSLVSLTIDGNSTNIVEDDATAIVTMRETYRIIQEDTSEIATFETTYAVLYQDGYLKIKQNLDSEVISREEETY